MIDWHSRFDGREWRVTSSGIESRGPDGDVEIHRTRGEPRTMRAYLAYWRSELLAASRGEGVPLSILLMTVATENGPAKVAGYRLVYPDVRREPGYVSDEETPHRISVGPCHILISSARTAMGDPSIDRQWLLSAGNNIRAAARFIRNQSQLTGHDPILVAAAYNAGSLYRAVPGESKWGNRWHLRTYGAHLDRAAAWYGDAVRVFAEIQELAALDQVGMGRMAIAS